MDVQTFMQSGLLEQYVLGQCSPDERALVERMAAQHPEVKAEMAAIEQALERFAFLQAVPPPEGAKERILELIDRETQQKAPKTFSIWPLAMLAFALLAALGYLLVRQNSLQSQNKKWEMAADSLRSELRLLDERVQKAEPVAALICDPDTKRILVADGKDLHTIVYYNPRTGMMAYDPKSLPAPPAGKHYQFWAIVDGRPISLGMVANAANICETMQKVAVPQAFAFSEEDSPTGNPAPTKVLAVGAAG